VTAGAGLEQKEKGVRRAGPESTTMKQVLLEFLFLAVAAGFVGLFGQNTPLMTGLICANIVARFIVIGRKNDWVFFLIGFVLGGGNDLLSMARGVYEYTPPHLLPLPIPIWMLLFWGQIFVAFRQLFQLEIFQSPVVPVRPWRPDLRLVADVVTFVVLRIIVYSLIEREPLLTIFYAGVVVLRFTVVPPKKREWLLIAAVTAAGVLYEAVLVAFGLYIYYDPVFLGMPGWLMIYWVFMIPVFMKGIFDRIEVTVIRRRSSRRAGWKGAGR
jgi:hypothetical protein